MRAIVLAAGVLLSLAHGANAQIIISGNTSDANITSVGGSASTGTNMRSGYGASPPRAFSYVIPFQLPDITGQVVTSATLDVRLNAVPVAATTYNINLYGLNARSTSTVLPDLTVSGLPAPDHYHGDFGGDTTDAFPLHDNFLIPGAAIGAYASSGGVGIGSTSLTDYLNNQYTLFGAGNFVFIRLSSDFLTVPPTTGAPTSGFLFASADDATAAFRPTLTITVAPIPEPSSMLLGATGLVGWAVARFRRQRTSHSH